MTDGIITLSTKEEEILTRWIYADKLLKLRKYKEEQLIDKIKERFSVSEYTARKDIYQAQALMGSIISINKKYLLHHHAEKLSILMETYSTDKSLVHLVPKLAAEYTKALAAIPDEVNKETPPAPQIIFNIVPGQAITTPKTYEEAVSSIAKRKSAKEYTDFDEVNEDS